MVQMGCWKGGELVSCNPKGMPGAEERFWWLERSHSLEYQVKREVEKHDRERRGDRESVTW